MANVVGTRVAPCGPVRVGSATVRVRRMAVVVYLAADRKPHLVSKLIRDCRYRGVFFLLAGAGPGPRPAADYCELYAVGKDTGAANPDIWEASWQVDPDDVDGAAETETFLTLHPLVRDWHYVVSSRVPTAASGSGDADTTNGRRAVREGGGERPAAYRQPVSRAAKMNADNVVRDCRLFPSARRAVDSVECAFRAAEVPAAKARELNAPTLDA